MIKTSPSFLSVTINFLIVLKINTLLKKTVWQAE